MSLLLCLVIAIADGDTLRVRCGEPGGYEMVTVRLAEIDAPEKRQPFGQRSKGALSDLCYREWAAIHPLKKDRYERTVARVECRGQDASSEQVRSGMAWAYTAYLTDSSILRLQDQARAMHVGLWREPHQIAPWDYRKFKRARSAEDAEGAHR